MHTAGEGVAAKRHESTIFLYQRVQYGSYWTHESSIEIVRNSLVAH